MNSTICSSDSYSELRKQKGEVIANTGKISKETENSWKVPSQTNSNLYYVVTSTRFGVKCSCSDYKKNIETKFAVDSSGFRGGNLSNWHKYKHLTQDKYHPWMKLHLICGVKTNIVPHVNVTSEFSNDCPELIELVKNTKKVFNIAEVSADKGYISKKNIRYIESIGAKGFIPFKKNMKLNSIRKGGKVWRNAKKYFYEENEDLLGNYHLRSNSESTFAMIKLKFGENLKNKSFVGKINELLCKVIAHNICVLIKEMYLKKIDIDLFLDEKNPIWAKMHSY